MGCGRVNKNKEQYKRGENKIDFTRREEEKEEVKKDNG